MLKYTLLAVVAAAACGPQDPACSPHQAAIIDARCVAEITLRCGQQPNSEACFEAGKAECDERLLAWHTRCDR